MNLKELRLTKTILRAIRHLKKSHIIREESKRRGGTPERDIARAKRFGDIKKEKYDIREDLVRSWGLGEIRPPSQQEKDQFFLYYHYLTRSYLIEVKKKYWNT